MRGLWLLALVGCRDDAPPPPIPDGIYKVTSVVLPADNDANRADGAILDSDGAVLNQLGMALASFSHAELYPTASVEVSLELAGDVLTLINHGVRDTPTPLQYEDGKVVAGGATATATIAIPGADPVQVDLTDATVRLDPITMSGALGGIVPTAQKVGRLYPAAVTALNAQVAKDCKRLDDPAGQCGCATGSNGFQILNIVTVGAFHCVIGLDDFVEAPLTASLIVDDTPTGISLGLGITTQRQ